MGRSGFPNLGDDYVGLLHRHPAVESKDMTKHVIVDLEDWRTARQLLKRGTKQRENFVLHSIKTLGGDEPEDFIESLQCAIVRAGGCFLPRSQLERDISSELREKLDCNCIAAMFMEKS